MPRSREAYIQALKEEYIVIEEATRLLDEIKSVLPDIFWMALPLEQEMSDKEYRKEARAAVIRELLEYLETELKPPPRSRPHLITTKKNMTDEILIKLLQLQFNHNKKISEVMEHRIDLSSLSINTLDIVLDTLGIATWEEDAVSDENNPDPFGRQWCWGTYDEMISEGTEEEFRALLDVIRQEQKKQA
jgi:hypothetical protein